MRELGDRTQRFCELQDALGGANSATLSQRLKLLEDEGLIDRRVGVRAAAVGRVLADRQGQPTCGARSSGIDRWADAGRSPSE